MKAGGISIGVVVLAAGASSRMARPKLLLPWGGTTILGHIAREWRALHVTQLAPVVRVGDAELEREWERLGNKLRIVNERADEGMFTSVRAASKWEGWENGISHFVVSLGDQPQIARETLSALLKCVSQFPSFIWQPSVNGRPKHPVVFPREIFRELGLSRAFTLRDFLQENQVKRRFMECKDPGLEIDLDTPEEYAVARHRFDAALREVA